jgi:phage tail tape-measure protein
MAHDRTRNYIDEEAYRAACERSYWRNRAQAERIHAIAAAFVGAAIGISIIAIGIAVSTHYLYQ